MSRPRWDYMLSELTGMAESDEAARLANAIEAEITARLRELTEALKPFADWADHHRETTHDHYVPECEIDGPGHSLTLTLGDFRAARAALKGEA